MERQLIYGLTLVANNESISGTEWLTDSIARHPSRAVCVESVMPLSSLLKIVSSGFVSFANEAANRIIFNSGDGGGKIQSVISSNDFLLAKHHVPSVLPLGSTFMAVQRSLVSTSGSNINFLRHAPPSHHHINANVMDGWRLVRIKTRPPPPPHKLFIRGNSWRSKASYPCVLFPFLSFFHSFILPLFLSCNSRVYGGPFSLIASSCIHIKSRIKTAEIPGR